MIKILIFLSTFFLFNAITFSQSTDFNHQIGISLKSSTNGFGGDLYYRPMNKLALKAGAEYLKLNLSSKTLNRFVDEDVNITISNPRGDDLVFNSDGKVKTGAVSIAVGYQFFKAMYVTAGVGKYLFDSEVIGRPLTDLTFEKQDIPGIGTINPKILKEDLGIFNITVTPSNTIIPFIGVGLGCFVPRNKSISFALEFGAYYVGSYVVNANIPTGVKSENIDYGISITQEQKDLISGLISSELNTITVDINREVNSTVNDINKSIEPYKFYPVLKLTIGFKAFEFKK